MSDFDAELVALQHRTAHVIVSLRERMERARDFLHETYLEVEAEIGRASDSGDSEPPARAQAPVVAPVARIRSATNGSGYRAPGRGHGGDDKV
jgi:hypothetical protein